MKNDQYDEAMELSQSHNSTAGEYKKNDGGDMLRMKTQSVSNRHFDEALEISQNSDESVDSEMRSLKVSEKKLPDPEDRKRMLSSSNPGSTTSTVKVDTKFATVSSILACHSTLIV